MTNFKRVISLSTSQVLLLLLVFITILSSCNRIIKEKEEKFDRQVSEQSKDELLIGDDINFWGGDTPRGSIFILRDKTSFLKGFAIKPLSFKEKGKPDSEIMTLISTEPIYQLEVYEIENPEKISYKTPQICEYISESFQKARLVKLINKLSFRVKERNWIPINEKVNPNSLIFVRLGLGELYSVIKDNATDGLWINAKRLENPWESTLNFEKNKIQVFSCQEQNFLESNVIQGVFYNPDVVFNIE